MNSNQLRGKLGGALLALFVLFSIALVSSTTAQAQYPYGRDGQYRRDRDRDRNQDRDWRRNRDWRRDHRERRNRRNRDYGNYGNNGGYGNNGFRIAQQRGYQDGINTGANDARRGQSYNPQRSHHYRNAQNQAYLNGFLSGYRQGFRQYGGNGSYGRRYPRNRAGGILGGIFSRP
jgi:hypothetical protein